MQGSDDTIILCGSRRSGILLLLAAPGFALGGWWMLQHRVLEGALVLLIAPLNLVAGVILLLPGTHKLVLGRAGFEVKSLWRSTFFRWEQVYNIMPVFITRERVPGTQRVGFRLKPGHTQSPTATRFLRAARGVDMMLPINYGLRATELADLMNLWRDADTSSQETNTAAKFE